MKRRIWGNDTKKYHISPEDKSLNNEIATEFFKELQNWNFLKTGIILANFKDFTNWEIKKIYTLILLFKIRKNILKVQ